MTQYYLNLTAAIASNEPVWEKEYEFTKLYNVTDMSGDTIAEIINKIENPNSTEFKLYFKSFSALYNTSFEQCDKECSRKLYCSAVALDYEGYAVCMATVAKNDIRTTDFSNNKIDISTENTQVVDFFELSKNESNYFDQTTSYVTSVKEYHSSAGIVWLWIGSAVLFGIITTIAVIYLRYYFYNRRFGEPRYVLL